MKNVVSTSKLSFLSRRGRKLTHKAAIAGPTKLLSGFHGGIVL
jgi:hypothetical protein